MQFSHCTFLAKVKLFFKCNEIFRIIQKHKKESKKFHKSKIHIYIIAQKVKEKIAFLCNYCIIEQKVQLFL